LDSSCEAVLPPRLVEHDGSTVRQIQTSVVRPHRQSQNPPGLELIQNVARQTTRFRAQQESIPGLETLLVKRTMAFRGQCKNSVAGESRNAVFEPIVLAYIDELAVIETCPSERRGIHVETERTNQMQLRADIGAQSNDVAGIWRYLRLIEDELEHDNVWGTMRVKMVRAAHEPTDD